MGYKYIHAYCIHIKKRIHMNSCTNIEKRILLWYGCNHIHSKRYREPNSPAIWLHSYLQQTTSRTEFSCNMIAIKRYREPNSPVIWLQSNDIENRILLLYDCIHIDSKRYRETNYHAVWMQWCLVSGHLNMIDIFSALKWYIFTW